MRCLVTGAAGFIGSHLSERLVTLGHDVVGVDSFNTYYDPTIKRQNVAELSGNSRFTLIEADLAEADLAPLLDGADWIFHLAGQPGVRGSWGDQFSGYLRNNTHVTQRLLEAARSHSPQRLVYASSSSIYGDAPTPMRESARPQPVSPYGVTKLSGEHLMEAYHKSYGVPAVSLRFFTVYGPRQRPDMAFNRFLRAIGEGQPVHLYGSGNQTRDFTYVGDIVDACLQAVTADCVGAAINLGGGSSVTVNYVLELLGEITGKRVQVVRQAGPRGDAPHTAASTQQARELLNWQPKESLVEGLRIQAEWQLGADKLTRRTAASISTRTQHNVPRLVIYGHDTYGLGHLRRNLTIAAGLSQAYPDLSLLLLTGSPAVQHFPLPPNVDYVKLPAVVKVADEHYQARTLRMEPAEIVQMRSAIVRETIASFAPDVLLVDHAPIGMKGELLPALQDLRKSRPQAKVVLGLRDIIDEPARVRATWAEQDVASVLERYYDSILVYGVPEVMNVVDAYQMSPESAAKTRYCGYLPRQLSSAHPQATRATYCAPGERLVVVAAGGGGDGYSLLWQYLRSLAEEESPERVASVVVTGPFMPADERVELERLAERHPRVRLIDFTDDMLALLQAADVVLCMGGYNTMCEVLSVGARALVAPRSAPRHEQLLRANAFERLGLARVIQPDSLTPQLVAQQIAETLASVERGDNTERAALDMFVGSGALDGVNATVRAIGELFERVLVAKYAC